jgi:hypothetical protein
MTLRQRLQRLEQQKRGIEQPEILYIELTRIGEPGTKVLEMRLLTRADRRGRSNGAVMPSRKVVRSGR